MCVYVCVLNCMCVCVPPSVSVTQLSLSQATGKLVFSCLPALPACTAQHNTVHRALTRDSTVSYTQTWLWYIGQIDSFILDMF